MDGGVRPLQRALSGPVIATIDRFGGEEPQGWGPQIAQPATGALKLYKSF
jgi:hypothetical protein